MPSGLDAPAAVRTRMALLTRSGFLCGGARFLRDFHFSEEHKEHGTLSLYTVTVRVIMDHMLNRLWTWVIVCVRADRHRISVDHRPAHPAGHQDTS